MVLTKNRRNFYNYFRDASRTGMYLGIFCWLGEFFYIICKEIEIPRLFLEPNFLLHIIISFLIYIAFGAILGFIIGIGSFFIQTYNLLNQGKYDRKKYFAFIFGFLIFTIIIINMYCFTDLSKSSFFLNLGSVIVIVFVSYLFSIFTIFLNSGRFNILRITIDNFKKIYTKKKQTCFIFLGIIFTFLIVIIISFSLKGSIITRNNVSQKNSEPSIIVILVDTLRGDHLSCLGFPKVITPAIDKLAEESVLFTNAYTQAPWTAPSVASFLTGLYPSAHGVIRGSKAKGGPDSLSAEALTLPEMLKNLGYYNIGLTTNPVVSKERGFSQGFDEYIFLKNKPIINRFSIIKWIEREFDIYLKNSFYVNAGALVDRANKWLSQNKTSSFFLFLHFMDPHAPYMNQPDQLWSKSDTVHGDFVSERRLNYLESYKNEITYADSHIGRLLAHLKKIGIYDNSIIVFFADHGEEFFEHGGWRHGSTLYEEVLRVPLIIKPHLIKKARSDHRIVRLIDVYPTILNILESDIPTGLQGKPIIDYQGNPLNNTSFMCSETGPDDNGKRAIRDHNWKFILSNQNNYPKEQRLELYDVEKDPGETVNLSSHNKELSVKLQSKMQLIIKDAKENSFKPNKAKISDDIKKQLKTLGYIN